MQICCAGEVMVEMSAADSAGQSSGLYRRGIAGDSYNTAVYLARAGLPVSYLTRLGDDGFSEEIISGRLPYPDVVKGIYDDINKRYGTNVEPPK